VSTPDSNLTRLLGFLDKHLRCENHEILPWRLTEFQVEPQHSSPMIVEGKIVEGKGRIHVKGTIRSFRTLVEKCIVARCALGFL